MHPGEDLAGKARDARMADIVVVLFSRESMPSRWPRAQWEDALVAEPAADCIRIAFVKCDDCVPPKVLAPQFTARQFRELKRWIRGHEPVPSRPPADLEVLGIAVADRPGIEFAESAELAAAFAREFRHDFDGGFTLQCGRRQPGRARRGPGRAAWASSGRPDCREPRAPPRVLRVAPPAHRP